MLNPWQRAESGTEHSEQSALFMWANMAARFGVAAANDPKCYTVKGHAQSTYGFNSGGLDTEALAAHQRRVEPCKALGRLYAVKNAEKGGAARGAMAVAEGVKAGVPDVLLPVMRSAQSMNPDQWREYVNPFGAGSNYGFGVVGGLYVELKRTAKRGAKGRASDEQNDWIPYLRRAGYAVAICYGWEEARDIILRYLAIDA